MFELAKSFVSDYEAFQTDRTIKNKQISSMIFRSIRKKLVISGKIRNYLVYALGEILLIVFGILIAWKINDLNEIRKNKIVQEKIYESLYEELNTNLNVLDSALVRYSNNTLSLQKSLKLVGLESNQLNIESKELILQLKFRNSNLRSEALSSINNTNKFQFIENESLTGLIAQYPSQLKSFQDQESKLRNIVDNRLKPVLEKHISLVDMLPDDNNDYKKIKNLGKGSDYSGLLNSRDYQNSIIDQLLQTKIQINIGKTLRKKTELLAIKLKQELNG